MPVRLTVGLTVNLVDAEQSKRRNNDLSKSLMIDWKGRDSWSKVGVASDALDRETQRGEGSWREIYCAGNFANSMNM
jgi:hypothetical protein